MVGTNFRPGFSGLCPAWTWKSPGMAPAQPLRVACSTCRLSLGRKGFSYRALQILLPTKFDWMTLSAFNHRKAATEGIRENTGFCQLQLAHARVFILVCQWKDIRAKVIHGNVCFLPKLAFTQHEILWASSASSSSLSSASLPCLSVGHHSLLRAFPRSCWSCFA